MIATRLLDPVEAAVACVPSCTLRGPVLYLRHTVTQSDDASCIYVRIVCPVWRKCSIQIIFDVGQGRLEAVVATRFYSRSSFHSRCYGTPVVMGKAKKTRKFAEVKRVLNPKVLKYDPVLIKSRCSYVLPCYDHLLISAGFKHPRTESI